MKKILIFLIIAACVKLHAKDLATIFQIKGCTSFRSEVNDFWVLYEADYQDTGCPCYNRQSGETGMIFKPHILGWFYVINGKCETYQSGSGPILGEIGRGSTCDIRDIEFSSFCVDAVLTDLSPSEIPALSEWGLILLGLVLAIFGIVAVRHRLLHTA